MQTSCFFPVGHFALLEFCVKNPQPHGFLCVHFARLCDMCVCTYALMGLSHFPSRTKEAFMIAKSPTKSSGGARICRVANW